MTTILMTLALAAPPTTSLVLSAKDTNKLADGKGGFNRDSIEYGQFKDKFDGQWVRLNGSVVKQNSRTGQLTVAIGSGRLAVLVLVNPAQDGVNDKLAKSKDVRFAAGRSPIAAQVMGTMKFDQDKVLIEDAMLVLAAK